MFNQTKHNKDKGFTIVELLVVIVVIGILAAITIVSYTGVTARAKGARAQSNAASAQSVAEAMNADFGYYPDTNAHFLAGQNADGSKTAIAKLPAAGLSLISDNAGGTVITAASGAGDGATIAYSCYLTCTNSTGGRIAYWNYGATPAAINYIFVGAAPATGGTFVALP